MICYVYSRCELVTYVVGVGHGALLGDALAGEPLAKRVRHAQENKPFTSMSDKRVVYCERIGSSAMHKSPEQVLKRAQDRAMQLSLEHEDL